MKKQMYLLWIMPTQPNEVGYPIAGFTIKELLDKFVRELDYSKELININAYEYIVPTVTHSYLWVDTELDDFISDNIVVNPDLNYISTLVNELK